LLGSSRCRAGDLHIFVNGRPVADPNRALLGRHGEIVVAFGRRAEAIAVELLVFVWVL
jgi:hypothetical protein